MLRRQIMAAVPWVLLSFTFQPAIAQELPSRPEIIASIDKPAEPMGLLTSRLKPKQLAVWREIEQLVFAEDAERQALHPTLRLMWEWIETSGHSVYVELICSNRTSSSTAGHFSITNFDPSGERHVATIKLNLPNIDHAYIGPNAARKNGFIPFTNLKKEERYAEVLGHEMAHAIHILTNMERARTVVEIIERTNAMLLKQHVSRKSSALAPEMKHRLTRRDALLKELEAQAEEMELAVWKELNSGKIIREKLATKAVK